MLSESAKQLSGLLQQHPVPFAELKKQVACIHQASDLLLRNLHHIDDKIDRPKQSIVQGHDGVTKVCRIADVFKSLESVWESSLAMHNIVLNIDVEQSADVLLYL